jgi:DNA-binding NarL/FixJ family response regulator
VIMSPMGPDALEEVLAEGRDALAQGDWERARACFERAGENEETAEVLDGLGEVARYRGECERAIALKERAFAAYRADGRLTEAAEAASGLSFLYAMSQGNFAMASGWNARAETVLEGLAESATHGRLILDRAPLSNDLSERAHCAASALEIAKRHGDADLEFQAQALLGETYVASGRVADGMRLLDEAMAAVSGGEVGRHDAVGSIYCRLLSACELVADHRRAREWMAFADRHSVCTHWVRPTCRTHYGGVLVALGRWEEAEEELLAAIREFEFGYRASGTYPLARLAELRVRQGRYEEAERLMEGAEWFPLARRAAATIALARGELELAEELAQLCFEGTDDSDPDCAPLLLLLTDIRLAQGEHAAAAETAERLAGLAADSGSELAAALADVGAGRVGVAAGDDRATGHLKGAVEALALLELPLEAARAQLELARALRSTAPDAAVRESRTALAAFERLGAARDADAAAGLLRELGAGGRPGPKGYGELTKREQEVLDLLAAGLSNAEIGERLYISPRTAEHHVARILAKLGLRSRAQAAAHAVREASARPVAE